MTRRFKHSAGQRWCVRHQILIDPPCRCGTAHEHELAQCCYDCPLDGVDPWVPASTAAVRVLSEGVR